MHKESRAVSFAIRVVLSASDVLTDAISQTLSRADDILLRVCPSDVPSLVSTCREFEPQLILLEQTTHLQSTLTLLQRLQSERSGVALMILAHEPNALHARRLLVEGARGYLLVSSLHDDLATTIRLAASGKTVLSPLVAQALLTLGN